ncbi:MAG TPA: DEAD/DEAH box helicase [Leptospiraceae bacterium]|nr:DEAD/DEAH box helicase [Leptospiraceae bacterium]HMW08310.1 DEAD/DEAH box helicase [Leptospiraceae bacterium]HMX33831.1 DEAD/DEAH box helicase [Leptospiraceae bacterium]HMY34183.1 DEAD/DEAH box helicase [Leptospiraceae bacterium]HMZ67437.1 DEAD/DEAH box helicase [Leptospiraceae bacterium]
MTFENLDIISSICKALEEEGYKNPTPIQVQSIPVALEGKDILGAAQTGTGKTAAFLVPILQRLQSRPKSNHHTGVQALVLAPTRELAVQIGDSIKVYGKYTSQKYAVIFGGVSQRNQENVLRGKIDIIVATPGRLLDLMNQKIIKLHSVNTLVLDEADKMLSMGFIDDVRKIISKIPVKRQTLFFSATMPKEIQKLADEILKDPVKVEVARVSSTNENIAQEIFPVDRGNKNSLLIHLLKEESFSKVLVFSRTKHNANKVVKELNRNHIKSDAIHGNKSQSARQKALDHFKSGGLRVLVATDIASRGIDIDDVTHVINYDLPNEPEAYVHRIGRTGRAGSIGKAISFCDRDERNYLRSIERLIKKTIPAVLDHPFPYGTHIPKEENKKPIEHHQPKQVSDKPKKPSEHSHKKNQESNKKKKRKKKSNASNSFHIQKKKKNNS